jgi:hypothetical protein
VPKYTASDDGKAIDGKVVVYLHGSAQADGRSGFPGMTAKERQETAAAQAATLTKAAQTGVPFCEECDRARQELAKRDRAT